MKTVYLEQKCPTFLTSWATQEINREAAGRK